MLKLNTRDPFGGTIVDLFVVRVNTDPNEGRGADYDHSYYLKREDAIEAAKGRDVMGTDGKVEKRIAVQCADGSVFSIKGVEISLGPFEARRRRQAALAVLTYRMTEDLHGWSEYRYPTFPDSPGFPREGIEGLPKSLQSAAHQVWNEYLTALRAAEQQKELYAATRIVVDEKQALAAFPYLKRWAALTDEVVEVLTFQETYWLNNVPTAFGTTFER